MPSSSHRRKPRRVVVATIGIVVAAANVSSVSALAAGYAPSVDVSRVDVPRVDAFSVEERGVDVSGMDDASSEATAAGVLAVQPVAETADEPASEPVNLVSNGGFEPGVPDQWWGISDDDVEDGQLCLAVPDVERFGNFVDLGLEEGETYRFSFTAKGDGEIGGLQARIQSDGATGPEIFDVQKTFGVDGESHVYQWTFTASGDAQRVQFELSGADPAGELCMSAVTVTPVVELVQNPRFDGQQPWWTSDGVPLNADAEGRMCRDVPAGGQQWDVILGQGGLEIEDGRTYTVTVAATAEPAASARILIPDPQADWPPLYYADITLGPDAQTVAESFEATESTETEFQLQLGGNAEPFTVCMELASVTTGGEADEFEHDTGPRVRVNQLGYLPTGPKNATLVTDAEESLGWELVDADDAVVASGNTVPQGMDESAGVRVHTIDFSDFDGTGEGYQLVADGEASYPFAITPTLYDQLRRDSLGVYYSQRSGIEIEPVVVDGKTYKKEYARPAGHLSEFGSDSVNQGDLAVPCLPNDDVTDHQGNPQNGGYVHYGPQGWDCPDGYRLDVSGGWYDAGDQGKYVVNSGISVYQLLSAYERTQHAGVVDEGALGDSTLIIPERGNGVPDVLDEVRWNLDWMLSMQVPEGTVMGINGRQIDAGGLVHHKLHDVAWTGLNTLPHEDPMPRYLHRPSTAATLNLAAAAAQGARLFQEYDAEYADQLLAAARDAWAAATAYPEIYAPNTNERDPNPGGGPYNDAEVEDEFYWAAAQLYLTTGEAEFEEAVLESPYHVDGEREDIWRATGFDWGFTAAAGRLDLAIVPNNLPGRAEVIESVVSGADTYLGVQEEEPFGLPYNPGDYDWGSNHQVLNNAVVIATAYDLTGKRRYADGALEAIDYVLGRNAINNSYVTGYGSHYSENMHSRWYASADRLPPFPPGKLAGGANSGIQDPVAQANLDGCAPQACYIDHVDSWSTNETTINWNAALAWYASWAADMGDSASAWEPPESTCTVKYVVHGVWPGGFNVQMWLENVGPTAIDGWDLSWRFPGDQQLVRGWNARFEHDGGAVTASNLSWNATLNAPSDGQSTRTLGFIGSGSPARPEPGSVTLNGLHCDVTFHDHEGSRTYDLTEPS